MKPVRLLLGDVTLEIRVQFLPKLVLRHSPDVLSYAYTMVSPLSHANSARCGQPLPDVVKPEALAHECDPTLRQIPDPWISASTIGTDGRDGLRTTASPMGRAPEPSILLPTSVHVEDPC